MQYYFLKSYARCVKINNEKSKKEPFLMKTVSLKTEYESLLCGCETPFSDYLRPQLRRDSYICLNGLWDFSVENRNNSDVDMCEFNGKTVINYAIGDQRGWYYTAEAEYDGPLGELLENFFR